MSLFLKNQNSNMSESEDLPKYFKNKSLSDITLVLQGRQIPAHRIVLASESFFFDKLFNGNFSDSSSPVLNLEHDDPDTLEQMVRFMYIHNDRSLDPDFAEITSDELGKLVTLADKNGVPHLVSLALKGLMDTLESGYNRTIFGGVLKALIHIPFHVLHNDFGRLAFLFGELAPQLARHKASDAILEAHPTLERFVVHYQFGIVPGGRAVARCTICDFCFIPLAWPRDPNGLTCQLCSQTGSCEEVDKLNLERVKDD
ncbi:hypothetical protein KVT40_003671 [Elsinoe batatas]|uniref:BTB domain-containing protein n=1 Tax=Elsinoe batatas TaxID=2601811 RepID=A0A8K0L422_9PEZI|nr:hypothetical protein KVT40_003671 [Elsinoe batatas]